MSEIANKLSKYIEKYQIINLSLQAMCAEFVNDLVELKEIPQFHTMHILWKRSIHQHIKQFTSMYYHPNTYVEYSKLNRTKLKLNDFQSETLAMYIVNYFEITLHSSNTPQVKSMSALNIDKLILRLKNIVLHL
jgi:hypothetical protein